MATISGVHHAVESRLGAARVSINRVGIWMFFLSETFLFGVLISTRFYLQGVQKPDELNQVLGLMITAVLLLSSLTAYRAETAAANGDNAQFKRNIIGTILLGLVFMAGVGFEWFEGYQHFPPSNIFGSIFFTTTGIHATHVLTGLILLGIVYYLGRQPGRFGKGNYWGVEVSVKYWHFVDVAWVFIYPTLYLVK